MANKLNNLQINSKQYWSLLKCLVELFSSFFSKQCSLINNVTTFPIHIQYLTNNRLSPVTFSQDDIAKIIQNLESSKARAR